MEFRGRLPKLQMAYGDGAFHPVEGDCKQAVYLIAVCAERGELAAGPDSHLVDLTEVAFDGVPDLERWRTTCASSIVEQGFEPTM